MHINQFIEYLKLEKKYSEKTLISYRADLAEFSTFFQAEADHEDISKAETVHLRLYLMALSEKFLSERTINRKISAIKSFYKFLLKTTQIQHSPTSNLKALKQYNEIQLPFSEDELAELFQDHKYFSDDFTGIRDRLMLDILYQTGIRRIELVNLTIENVDFFESRIKVLGKRNKQRLIPISKELLTQIESYISFRNNHFKSAFSQLFLTDKGKPIYDKLVYQRVNYYLSKVSTKQKTSPHMLRHSFATHMLNRGAELNAVKEILGHSSLSATQVYAHGSIEQLKEVFNQAHPRERQKTKKL